MESESRIKERAAGATEKAKTEAEVKGKIIEFAWWLKKYGYSEATIKMWFGRVADLVRLGCNLLNPESVKETIALQSWNITSKTMYVDAYNSFARFVGISWEKPKYRSEARLPLIPTETDIDQLIASCGKKTAAFLQLLKETGMRACEAEALRWADIDVERQVVYVRGKKRSDPGCFQCQIS